MKISLTQTVGPNSPADDYDIKQIKKALNRLGYYTPQSDIGISGFTDSELFTAIKQFQSDHGLETTGAIRPDDDTLNKLQSEATKKKTGKYIWRTVGDEKVRSAHAALNGQIRDYADSPDPGEDFNCRCWAEEIDVPKKKPLMNFHNLNQTLMTEVTDAQPSWDTTRFLTHFAIGFGRTVSLEECGYLGDVISKAEEIMYHRLESQIANEMRNIKNGIVEYNTARGYSRLSEVHPVFGGGTIKTYTIGKVTKKDNTLSITATISYQYHDIFTDPRNHREEAIGTSDPSELPWWYVKTTDYGGTYFNIVGEWMTRLTGTIPLEQKNNQ